MRQGKGLPSGTVTFLFTDIERSTQTVEAMGDEAYADALDVHRQLLRDAFKTHGGHEVGTEGDSFFVAFASATDAAAAAVEGQRKLAGQPLRVRMGLHTGEALVRGGDYIGHDVHKAKRISDAGHGGQILLSETTVDLVRGSVDIRDLGPHRLKDLEEAQRIYQVGDDQFPRLRSLEAFRHTLPAQRSSFVGREAEIAEVRKLLENNRLVTLTGIGGCGKTRLALQVGAELLDSYTDGVYFADLAPISDGSVLPQTIAAAVAIPASSDPSVSVEEQLLNYLSQRCCLLIVDNCEHLLDECAEIVDRILTRCPDVSVLATSREALEVEGEQSWRVPSMPVPEDEAGASGSEAVSLFKTRAQAADPAFELTPDNVGAVVEICRRLDGIPLAIEFAAARVAHLSPRQIADRLGDMFRLLTGGRRRVQRQQTLQAALDWSYELLTEEEQILLRRLAVFSGGFTLLAAEQVCSGEGIEESLVVELLGSLVSKSLVATESGADETRYRLLETVRLYAEDKLRFHGEADLFRARHRDHYLEWIESIPFVHTYLDRETVDGLAAELGNLRTALRWSLDEDRIDLVGRMAGRLTAMWGSRALQDEGYSWLAKATEAPEALGQMTLVECLTGQAFLAMTRVEAETVDIARRAVEAAGGDPSAASVLAQANLALNLSVFAEAMRSTELAEESRRYADRSLETVEGMGPALEAWASLVRVMTEVDLGDIETAERFCRQGIDRLTSRDEPLRDNLLPSAYHMLAHLRHLSGDDEGALEAALAGFRETEMFVGFLPPIGRVAMVIALVGAGDVEAAWEHAVHYMEMCREFAMPLVSNDALIAFGALAFRAGNPERASRLLSTARHAGVPGGAYFRSPFGYALYRHYTRKVRDALGSEVARRIRDEAKAMSLDEAVSYALEGLDD